MFLPNLTRKQDVGFRRQGESSPTSTQFFVWVTSYSFQPRHPPRTEFLRTMARSTFAAVALALVCCIVTAQAQLVYTGECRFRLFERVSIYVDGFLYRRQPLRSSLACAYAPSCADPPRNLGALPPASPLPLPPPLARQWAPRFPFVAGPESFINSFDTAGNQLTAEGAMISIISAGQVYGSNVAGMSASLINLDPCTIIEPHTHPHSEFAFTVYGSVTHSTPYNNLTLFNLTANEGTAEARGFAIFPSSEWKGWLAWLLP